MNPSASDSSTQQRDSKLISISELNQLIDPLTPEKLDSRQQLDTFARAAWSHLAEPSDSIAGFLVQQLSAVEALHLVVEKATPEQIFERLNHSDVAQELEQLSGGVRNPVDVIRDGLDRWNPRVNQQSVIQSLREQANLGGFLLRPADLASVVAAKFADLGFWQPFLFYCLGDGKLLAAASSGISVVGSRAMSRYGEAATHQFAGDLVDRGKCVVSGGAYGIDAVAHQAVLALNGQTVAVMAGGLGRLYPIGNLELLKNISRLGLVLSELPPSATPTKWRFLRRNRLIAAATSYTLIIEAGIRSGAINTAHHAAELGRPVGAIPGLFYSQNSAGCHRLIREGIAELVTAVDDIFNTQTTDSLDLTDLGDFEIRILDCFQSVPLSFQEIRKESGLTTSEAERGLASLELIGLLVRQDGSWRRVQTTL